MFANEAVDVLGVVDSVADSALIQTRDGKDVSCKDLPILICSAHGNGWRLFCTKAGTVVGSGR